MPQYEGVSILYKVLCRAHAMSEYDEGAPIKLWRTPAPFTTQLML